MPLLASCRLNRRSKESEQTQRPFHLRQILVLIWLEWLKPPQVSVRLQAWPELEQERSPRLLAQAQESPDSVQPQWGLPLVQLAQQALPQEPVQVLLEPQQAPSLSAGMGPGSERLPVQPAEPVRAQERPVWRLLALEEVVAHLPAHRRAGPLVFLD